MFILIDLIQHFLARTRRTAVLDLKILQTIRDFGECCSRQQLLLGQQVDLEFSDWRQQGSMAKTGWSNGMQRQSDWYGGS